MQETLLKDDRKFWKYLLFTILTCGIYGIIFWWKLIEDLNVSCDYVEKGIVDMMNDSGNTEQSGEGTPSPNYLIVILLSAVTCGIYYFVWLYKQGNRIQRAGREYGLEIAQSGTFYLLWSLFGSALLGIGPIITTYFLITNINKLCKVYNFQMQQPKIIPTTPSDELGGPSKPFYHDLIDDITTQRGRAEGSIRWTKGTYSGARITIKSGEELTIGRNGSLCQFVISEPDISRKHCTVRYSKEDGYFWIVDYSTYGVFINGNQRLEKGVSTKCSLGTKLSLGNGNNVFILE